MESYVSKLLLSSDDEKMLKEEIRTSLEKYSYEKKVFSLDNIFEEFFNETPQKAYKTEIPKNSEYFSRFITAANENGITVLLQPNIGLDGFAANAKMQAVRIGPIVSRNSFLAAMHELGHLVGNWQSFRNNTLLEMEAGAWQWARNQIYDWKKEDGEFRRFCLCSYIDTVEKKYKILGEDTNYRENNMKLFPKPPENHIVWEMMKNDMV